MERWLDALPDWVFYVFVAILKALIFIFYVPLIIWRIIGKDCDPRTSPYLAVLFGAIALSFAFGFYCVPNPLPWRVWAIPAVFHLVGFYFCMKYDRHVTKSA